MRKKFNVTGLCLPDQHYMADVSKKLAKIVVMVEDGDYFIIQRPRQYGKTTTLNTLAKDLLKTEEYIVFHTNFGGVDDLMFTEETLFSQEFVKLLAGCAMKLEPTLANWLLKIAPTVKNIPTLSDVISTLVDKTKKKVVLIIDDVDSNSNNQRFMDFLGLLREK